MIARIESEWRLEGAKRIQDRRRMRKGRERDMNECGFVIPTRDTDDRESG